MNGDAFHWCRKTLNYNLGKHDLLRILGRETSLSLFLPHTYTQFITDTVVNRTVVMCLSKRRNETNIRTGCNSILFHCTCLIPSESSQWFVSIHVVFMRTHFNKEHRFVILNIQTIKVWWRTWPLHLHYSGWSFAMRPWPMTLQISCHLHLK